MPFQSVEELRTFIASSSINDRMNWAREVLINNDGWLKFVTDSIVEVADDLMVANCRGWDKQKRLARLTFSRYDGFLWGDIVYNRAMRQTGDSYFAIQYQRAVASFRHATDAHIIEMTFSIFKHLINVSEKAYVYEFSTCAETVFKQFGLRLKPDQRRTIQTILILQRMFPGLDIRVGDFKWLESHLALFRGLHDGVGEHLVEMRENGFQWRHLDGPINTHAFTTVGLSSGNRSELKLVFTNTDKMHPDAFSNLLDGGLTTAEMMRDAIGKILQQECVDYGVDIRYVQRDVQQYIRKQGKRIAKQGSTYQHLAMAGSVFPQHTSIIEIDMTHESLHGKPVAS